jgi:CRP-like cAMP-binding protein
MKRSPHSASSPSITERIVAVSERESGSENSARVPSWLMRFLASTRYLAAAIAALTIGGVIAGDRGLVIVAVLLVIAVPVIGFTCNQMTLTSKGRKLATTVNEVRALKESDAVAFSQPLAIVLRRTQMGQMYADNTSLPQAIGQNLELRRSAPLEIWRNDDPELESEPEFMHSPRPRFWPSLTSAEQQALQAVGQIATFPSGAALCRQSEHAEFVFIIFSGLAKVYVAHPDGGRALAIRGPGDVIGERAAFQVRSRSATVIAMEAMQVLVIPTVDFAVLLDHHPRVLQVLERRVYDRLTEIPQAIPGLDSPESEPWQGQNCSIFLADIAAFGGHDRNDDDRQVVRDEMYVSLRDAFESSDVPWWACHREDRGDGALVVVPPSIPTKSLVDPLLIRLATALRRYNRQVTQATRMQLRVALNVGPVVSDPQGVSGEAIILAARLLEAPALKKALAKTAADLGVIVSPFIYDSVIKHSPGYVDPAQYHQLRFRVKESDVTAWMYLSGR